MPRVSTQINGMKFVHERFAFSPYRSFQFIVAVIGTTLHDFSTMATGSLHLRHLRSQWSHRCREMGLTDRERECVCVVCEEETEQARRQG